MGKRDSRNSEQLTEWVDFLHLQKASEELKGLKEWIVMEKLIGIDFCLGNLRNKLFTHSLTMDTNKLPEQTELVEQPNFEDLD